MYLRAFLQEKFDYYIKNCVICASLEENDLKFKGKMSKICQITGKKMMVGNNVSHSKRRTKRTFQPNLFDKKFYLEEEDRFVNLRLSAQAIRTINKNGLKVTLDNAVKKGFLKSY